MLRFYFGGTDASFTHYVVAIKGSVYFVIVLDLPT